MWKYFTHRNTLKYIDILPNLVKGTIILTTDRLNCAQWKLQKITKIGCGEPYIPALI
ncbi:hypothetical protein HOLleu_12106 [Holothuria leucospilota]|uniref:Uncharacterized protein n=1 Tax=Holothuria leucospilota TaxID=206669 RepID=A0A9Q1CAE2_HOLLE|nr:hypothetical protein HOLleu_12106 [Holothuria leucospilota]